MARRRARKRPFLIHTKNGRPSPFFFVVPEECVRWTDRQPPSQHPMPAAKKKDSSFKIKLRGKDNAPLSMKELRQGLYDIARKMERYKNYRAKWATLYITLVDEDGTEVCINKQGEWTLYPYRSAADEHDL